MNGLKELKIAHHSTDPMDSSPNFSLNSTFPKKKSSVRLYFVFKLVLFGIFILAFIELCFLIRRPYWPSLLVIFFIITSLFLVDTYEANRLLFLYSILISVLNDSGAYYLGKKLGSRKIFPKTSPNKTLEGQTQKFVLQQ